MEDSQPHFYQEVLAWLRDEESRGHPVDVLCLQETAWKEDFEYITATTSESDAQWHAIHAGGPAKTGILILIRRALLPAASIRYVVLIPGRLVHVRLLFHLPLDILCTYQTAWNPTNSSLAATNKADALVRQRAKLWAEMEKWLNHIPLRNGTLILGDMNTPLIPEHPVCGPGVATNRGPVQRDQEDFQALLRRTGCQALNTWRAPGISSRTYLPPSAGPTQHGTQIDFIVARGSLADHEARQANTLTAPFVPTTGCRHLLLQTTIPLPRRPKPPLSRTTRLVPARVQDLLRDKTIPGHIWREVEPVLTYDEKSPDPDIDTILLEGWQRHAKGHQASSLIAPTPDCTLHLIRQLWSLRAQLQRTTRPPEPAEAAPCIAAMWTGWRRVVALQQVQRELRKQGRLKKIRMVEQAVHSDNVFRAARRFGPKTPKQRLQLRDKDGRAQTVEEEFRDIVEYFTTLYGGEGPVEPERLQAPLNISWEEVDRAVCKLSPGKAMPWSPATTLHWQAEVECVEAHRGFGAWDLAGALANL